MRQEGILLPDVRQQLKIKTFHPWSEYTTTSEARDLAIIELVEGFHLSQKLSMNIMDRRTDLLNKKFSEQSMSINLLIIWQMESILQ